MSSSEEREISPVSVADFYNGKTVFITGCTGFIGKALVSKLLRSCPNTHKIYVLIRPKKHQNIHERLQQLLRSPVFDEVRRERPLDLQKIQVIGGDIKEPLLGLKIEDCQMLCHSVNIVFHTAATVKFNEALKEAVAINLFGTQRLVELCNKMTCLQALVHVSTAFAHCDRENINEVLYPPPKDPKIVSWLVQERDETFINLFTPYLLGKHPNTYTFTKALTEHWLHENYGSLPLVIVRPSIVTSSIVEPKRGWVDNWNGATGIVAGIGKGIMRSLNADGDKAADLIPVDMVVNLILVTAWHTGTKPKDEIAIYNCVSGLKRAITWKHFINSCLASIRQYPFQATVRYPNASFTSSCFEYQLKKYFMQYVFAYILDGFCWLVGKNRILVDILNKLVTSAETGKYILNNEWNFDDKNVGMLYGTLSKKDRLEFCFDASTIKWDSYIEDYMLGIRRFMMLDELSSIDNARRTLRILFWGNWLLQLIGLFALIWCISLVTCCSP